MLNIKNQYFKAFIIFSIVFIISALFWLSSISGEPIGDSPTNSELTTISISLITSIVSLIGTILTLLLSVRKEQREHELAQLALERQRLELERERLALEKLKPEEV